MSSFLRLFSLLGVVVCLSGLLLSSCGQEPAQRPCKEAGDCLFGESCVNGFCGPEQKEAVSDAQKEATPEAGVETVAADEPQVSEAEPIVEKPVTEKPVTEIAPETPAGCGTGAACVTPKICVDGSCVSRLCGPCQGAGSCGKELCLRNSAGETFCGRTCTGNDSCPPSFSCVNIGGQLGSQCVPSGSTCKNPLGLGAPCQNDADPSCPFHFPYCTNIQSGKTGLCSLKCNAVAECPSGFKQCMDRGDGVKVCLKGCQTADDCPIGSKLCADDGSGVKTCQKGCRDHRDCSSSLPHCVGDTGKKQCQAGLSKLGPEFCGTGKGNTKGVATPCPNGVSDCTNGATLCLGKGITPLQPFCSRSCTTDTDCGDGAFCREIDGSSGKQKVCLPDNCLCLTSSSNPQGQRDLLAEALKAIGFTRCSLVIAEKAMKLIPAMIANDPFRLGFYNRLHREPLQLLTWGKQAVKSMDRTLTKTGVSAVSANLANAARWLDAPIQTQSATITVPSQDPLTFAVSQLIKDQGGTPDMVAIKADAADVPAALQTSLAKIILAISAAATLRTKAFPPDVAKNPRYYFDRAHTTMLIGTTAGLTFGSPNKPGADYWVLAKDFGYQSLYQGAWNLSDAIAQSGLKVDANYKGFSFSQSTPLGRIIVSDNTDNTYKANDPKYQGPIALLVDTGGNDIYEIQAGANVSEKNGVSVLIDLDGNDTYGYEVVKHPFDVDNRFPSDQDGRYNPPNYCLKDSDCGLFKGPCINRACQRFCDITRPCPSNAGSCNAKKYCSTAVRSYGPVTFSVRARQGGARLGIAFLFDLGKGKDTYRSLRMSQGFAVMGVGVLYDEGGDDLYQCEAGCQGSAAFGIGLLIDREGNDSYLTYANAQGFAYAKAAGLLLDGKGDDKYLADHGDPTQPFRGKMGDPLYLSAQLPGQGNSAFVQGAAFGRRADFTDRMFMSGGLAILRDIEGDDEYTAGVFGQGAGFWYGTGILSDGNGKDKYDGLWYVQGATAHYAMSLFLEGGGDDLYNSRVKPRATHTGVGHDYSISWLVDDSGNDNYRGGGLTLGAGNDNGFGFLIDNDGNDTYAPGNTNSVGRANSPNPPSATTTNPRNTAGLQTVGIFIDAKGLDTYTRSDGTKILSNNKTWTQGRSPDNSPRRKLEHGVGVDGTGSSSVSSQ